MDPVLVMFLVWASALVFLVGTCARSWYNCIREAAVHRPPPRVSKTILLQLDKVTYPRRNSLPAASISGGGGCPSTTESESDSDSEDCAICLGQFEDGDRCSVMPICRHEFHRDCIADWLVASNNTCPLCRAQLQWSLVAQDMV